MGNDLGDSQGQPEIPKPHPRLWDLALSAWKTQHKNPTFANAFRAPGTGNSPKLCHLGDTTSNSKVFPMFSHVFPSIPAILRAPISAVGIWQQQSSKESWKCRFHLNASSVGFRALSWLFQIPKARGFGFLQVCLQLTFPWIWGFFFFFFFYKGGFRSIHSPGFSCVWFVLTAFVWTKFWDNSREEKFQETSRA